MLFYRLTPFFILVICTWEKKTFLGFSQANFNLRFPQTSEYDMPKTEKRVKTFGTNILDNTSVSVSVVFPVPESIQSEKK